MPLAACSGNPLGGQGSATARSNGQLAKLRDAFRSVAKRRLQAQRWTCRGTAKRT